MDVAMSYTFGKRIDAPFGEVKQKVRARPERALATLQQLY